MYLKINTECRTKSYSNTFSKTHTSTVKKIILSSPASR